MDIYDRDNLVKDDFVGRSIISVCDTDYTSDRKIPEPKWHPVRIKQGAPTQGEILVSFAIVE